MRRYSCIVDASYALFLYMLYASDKMLTNTTYYVGGNLSTCHLPNKIVMPPIIYSGKGQLMYRLFCLKYRIRLCRTTIYAQDHLPFSAPLIDNLPYICLEDCPNFYLIREERGEPPYKDSIGARWYNFKVGRIYLRYAGNNPWCMKRIITSERDKILLERKKLAYEQFDLERMWLQASPFKRQTIINTFDLPEISCIKKDIVIFSQPLITDAHMTEDEVASIFRPYIERYGEENILVKLHPRDTFDYKKYFSNISILCTKAPQQLLSIMGIHFKTAITICSSAVSSMDSKCKVIWLGAEIDERIVKAYGHVKNPVNC